MLKVGRGKIDRESPSAVSVQIWHDGNVPARPMEEGEEGAHLLEVWVRPLIGRDTREINNSVLETDKRGKTATLAGDIPMLRVCRSVVDVEGLEDGSRKWSRGLYDAVPQWINDRILAKLDEINEELDPEE